MKKFIVFQIALIAATAALCLYARSQATDVGISQMDTIEKIHESSCDNVAVISTTDDLNSAFSQFDYGSADRDMAMFGEGLYGTVMFVGSPDDEFSFSKGSTFCTLNVDRVISGTIDSDKIDVEISGGFYYETNYDYEERLMNAADMEMDTPDERLFTLNLGGMNFMVPGEEYLIIAQTINFDGITHYRLNGYQISWLALDETVSQPMKEEYTYADCCDNEIFSPEQEVIDLFYQKKSNILKTYDAYS